MFCFEREREKKNNFRTTAYNGPSKIVDSRSEVVLMFRRNQKEKEKKEENKKKKESPRDLEFCVSQKYVPSIIYSYVHR